MCQRFTALSFFDVGSVLVARISPKRSTKNIARTGLRGCQRSGAKRRGDVARHNIRSLVHFFGVPVLVAPLSACTDMQSPTSPVGPGPYAADHIIASQMFTEVCAKTYPSLSAAREAIDRLPFDQNSGTGTYYHRKIDLSFKLTQTPNMQVCSMVMGTNSKEALVVEITFGAAVGSSGITGDAPMSIDPDTGSVRMAVKDKGDFSVRLANTNRGRAYYNAAIIKNK